MSKRLSAEQLLEAALKKIESHEPQTIKWAIKRLRARLELAAPQRAPLVTATDALADLAEDE
jgi:DNA-binding response OmpR family regulator